MEKITRDDVESKIRRLTAHDARDYLNREYPNSPLLGNIPLFINALTTPDAAMLLGDATKSNRDLATLGDAVLECVLRKHLCNYPNRGSKLEHFKKRKTLGDVAQNLHLGKMIINVGEVTYHIRAEAFEAVIGAIYKHAGIEKASEFIHKAIKGLPPVERGLDAVPGNIALDAPKVSNAVGYKFSSKIEPLLQKAFTAPSANPQANNSDLAFEGHAILRMAMVEFFLSRKDLDYSLLTKFLSRDFLANVLTEKLRLGDCIIAGKIDNVHLGADVINSIAKAIYADALETNNGNSAVALGAVKKFVTDSIIPENIRNLPQSATHSPFEKIKNETKDAKLARTRLEHFNNWRVRRRFEHKLGHIFVTPEAIDLLRTALTTEGAGEVLDRRHYGLLEMLGDAILGNVISEYLVDDPNRKETFKRLTSRHTLPEIARNLGIHEILIHPSPEGVEPSKERIEAALEAIIGVLYLTKGYQEVKEFIFREWKLPQKEMKKDVEVSYKEPPRIKPQLQELDSRIPEIEKTIGYVFSNKDFLRQALIHGAIQGIPNQGPLVLRGNDTLKLASVLYNASIWLGGADRIKPELKEFKPLLFDLGIVAQKIFESEFLMHDALQDRSNLAKRVEEMGLKDVFVLYDKNLRNNPKIVGNVFVALIQAVYEDVREHTKSEEKAIQKVADFFERNMIQPYIGSPPISDRYHNTLLKIQKRHPNLVFEYRSNRNEAGYEVAVVVRDTREVLFEMPYSKPHYIERVSEEVAIENTIRRLARKNSPFRHTAVEALREVESARNRVFGER